MDYFGQSLHYPWLCPVDPMQRRESLKMHTFTFYYLKAAANRPADAQRFLVQYKLSSDILSLQGDLGGGHDLLLREIGNLCH